MASVRLLQIKTPFAMLELHGPIQSRWGATQNPSELNAAHFSVEATAGPTTVCWVDLEGATHTWPNVQGGPRFFEDTTYRLRVKSLVSSHNPVLQHRDPNLFQEVDAYRDELSCIGPINFRRQVGYSVQEVHVANDTLRVTIEVFPVKLDYEQDYMELLSEVASASRGLVLEYLRATYRHGTIREEEHVTNLEWLTIVRNEIEVLEGVYEVPRLASRRTIVVPAAAQIMASLVAVSAS